MSVQLTTTSVENYNSNNVKDNYNAINYRTNYTPPSTGVNTHQAGRLNFYSKSPSGLEQESASIRFTSLTSTLTGYIAGSLSLYAKSTNNGAEVDSSYISLSVSGTSTFSAANALSLYLGSSNLGNKAYNVFNYNTDTSSFSRTFQISPTTTGANFRWYPDGTTNLMSLTSAGLVIGTTSPTALLDINSTKIRLRTANTPASATATGNQGDICWDANYVYICVATNTWKRSALASW